MAKAEVYFIELTMPHHKDGDVCQLAERIYNARKSVCIYCADEKQAQKLDKLLWTWRNDSFVPHQVLDEQTARDEQTVAITCDAKFINGFENLILFDPLSAERLSGFTYLFDFAEIYSEEKKQASRQRFKALRDSDDFEVHFIKRGAFLRNVSSLTKT